MAEIRAITAPGVHDKVVSMLPSPPASVLDVGAGPGALSSRLCELGYTVRACDMSPEDFRVPGVACDRVNLAQGLPYRADEFDAVVLVEVVEHLEHPFLAAQEAVRVAKPGGVIVVTTPNIQSFLARCHYFLRGNFGRWYKDEEIRGTDPRPGFNHIMPLHPLAVYRLIERSGAIVEDVATNEMLQIRSLNSAWSLAGKFVEVFLTRWMRPTDPILIRGDILLFKARKLRSRDSGRAI